MKYVLKFKMGIAGIFVGAILGLLYWKFVGCSSGSCSITSVWYNSTLYGAVLGWLVFDLFRQEKKA
jgi:F0F1-type ATP synthase assembly protein I